MRATITRLVTVLVVLLAAVAVEAQQPGKLSHIGYLAYSVADRPYIDAFRQGLHELGYVEGQNIVIERRFVEGRIDRLPEFAAELVHLKVGGKRLELLKEVVPHASRVAVLWNPTVPERVIQAAERGRYASVDYVASKQRAAHG